MLRYAHITLRQLSVPLIPNTPAWELIKGKLLTPGGQEAVEKAASEPGKDRNWDTLKNYLLDALEQDAAFREQLERLLGTVVNQTAIGRGIKQPTIINSPGSPWRKWALAKTGDSQPFCARDSRPVFSSGRAQEKW